MNAQKMTTAGRVEAANDRLLTMIRRGEKIGPVDLVATIASEDELGGFKDELVATNNLSGALIVEITRIRELIRKGE